MLTRTMTTNPITSKSRYIDGLTLLEESILKPDARLRNCARSQGCYKELMQVRQELLEYIHSLHEKALNE